MMIPCMSSRLADLDGYHASSADGSTAEQGGAPTRSTPTQEAIF
jgi:hypothetical protein